MFTENYDTKDNIFALATPYSQSAIAVIRLSGESSIENLAKCFSDHKKLLEAKGNTIVYGKIVDKNLNINIDEVLISVFKAPKSYTGEDSAEINCHGSLAGIDAIFDVLKKENFRQALPGEFSFRAFLNGKIDLSQAEAVNDIVQAKTKESHLQSLNNLCGNIFNKIESLKDRLLKIFSLIELQLDYAEDDFEEHIDFPIEDLKNIYNEIETLIKTFDVGKIYKTGITIAIAGKTNAGKSSLFNLFLKEDRSIVSDIHGTTRDYLGEWINLKGIPTNIFDTAGIRDSDNLIEKEGIKRTENIIKNCDIILYVIDSKIGETTEDKLQLKNIDNKNLIRVFNKSDILTNLEQQNFKDEILVSSKNCEGFSKLEDKIFSIIKNKNSFSADVIVSSKRQKDFLEDANRHINHILKLKNFSVVDGIAVDLKGALDALGKITGEITTDDILSSIFNNFCVGK